MKPLTVDEVIKKLMKLSYEGYGDFSVVSSPSVFVESVEVICNADGEIVVQLW